MTSPYLSIASFGLWFLFLGSSLLAIQNSDGTPSSDKVSEPMESTVSTSDYSLIPYQRIFLPKDGIDEFEDQLKGYSQIAVSELQALLKRYQVDQEIQDRFRQPPELESLYVMARLDGADLISNLSRIRISRGSVTSEMMRLSPWSLAMGAVPLRDASRPNLSDQNGVEDRWCYDSKGAPLLKLHAKSVEEAMSPLDVPFEWSRRSLPNSNPNQLAFSFDHPRVRDACLLLVLPPQSSVVDCDVAAYEVHDWQNVSKRFGDWASQAESEWNQRKTPGSSLWLIELSGTQRSSFSISFESSIGSKTDSSYAFEHFVIDQSTEHEISSVEIRSTSKIDIANDRTQWERDLSFRLPEPSRLHRLTVAGRDVQWKYQNGIIVCSSDELRRIPTTKDPNETIRIEYSTFIDELMRNPLESDTILLPSMALENSFVLRGVSSVKTLGDAEMVRLSVDAKLKSIDRDDEVVLEWWGYCPEIRVAVHPKVTTQTPRAIARLHANEGQPVVTVRLLLPNANSSSFTMELAKEWEYAETSLEKASNGVTLHHVESAAEGAQLRLVIDLNSSRRYWDFQVRPAESWNEQRLNLDSLQIRVNGTLIKTTLVIDDLPPDWRLDGVSAPLMGVSVLHPEERSALNPSDRALVYSLGTKASSPLYLERMEQTETIRCGLEVNVERLGVSMVRAFYRFHLLDSQDDQSLILDPSELSKGAKLWTLLDEDGNIVKVLEQLEIEGSDGRLVVPVTKTVRVIQTSFDSSIGNEGAYVPIPKRRHGILSPLHFAVDDTLTSNVGQDWKWEFRPDGRLGALVPNDVESISVRASPNTSVVSSDKELKLTSTANCYLDGQGFLQASWVIEMPSSGFTRQTLALEPDWDFEANSIEVNREFATAWLDNEKGKSRLFIVSSNTTRNQVLQLQFRCYRKERLPIPKLGEKLRVNIPKLFRENATVLSTSGTLWLPNSLSWSAEIVDENLHKLSELQLAKEWWVPPSQWLFVNDHDVYLPREQNSNDETNGDIGGSDQWRQVAVWQADETLESISLKNDRASKQASMFILFSGTIAGYALMRLSKWMCAIAFIACGLSMLFGGVSREIYVLLSFVLSGAFVGIILFQLHQLARNRDNKPMARSSNSTAWEPKKPISADIVRGFVIAFLIIQLAAGSHAYGQEDESRNQTSSKEVILLYDSLDNQRVDKAFVSNRFLKMLNGNSGAPYVLKTAKHSLKLLIRGRTIEGVDQATSTYEFDVLQANTPIEIPFRSLTQSFVRASVVTQNSQLLASLTTGKDSLTWMPDKVGMQKLQIDYSPRPTTRSLGNDSSSGITLKDLELPVFPASNAILEVETEPTIQFEVESQGIVLDPVAGKPVVGKYTVLLGALPMIRGQIQYALGLAPPNRTNNRNANGLTLEIEMLLQSKTVIAKTVIKASPSMPLDKRLTMEADMAWEPVGSNWGNLKLVEVKDGRLRNRKRYVFEWAGGSDGRTNFEYSIYWALKDKDRGGPKDDEKSDPSLLFAECIEPLLRPTTFRFARFSRTEWNVEQVSTWTPALNEPELLNWPEFKSTKADQRATSLRVPQTGGGYLRKSALSKSLKARIASQWSIQNDGQILTSRIELAGTANSDFLELELPSGFSIDQVTNRSTPVRVLERSQNGLRIAQLIAERTNWENYDFTVRAIRKDGSADANGSIPWMNITNAQITEQTIDLAATSQWMIDVVSATKERRFFGKDDLSLTSLNPGDQVQYTLRPNTAKGTLSATLVPKNQNQYTFDISGVVDSNKWNSATLLLEIPTDWAGLWSCDVTATTRSCPVPGKTWIQVPLATATNDDSRFRFALSFVLTKEQLKELVKSPDLVGHLNPEEIRFETKLRDLISALELPFLGQSSSPFTEGYLVESKTYASQDQVRSVRKFWMLSSNAPFSWQVPENVVILDGKWNGEPIRWTRRGDTCEIIIPPLPKGVWGELELEFQAADDNAVADKIHPLGKNDPSFENELSNSESEEVLKLGLRILRETRDAIPVSLAYGSSAHQLMDFWWGRIDALLKESVSYAFDAQSPLVDEAKQLLDELKSKYNVTSKARKLHSPRDLVLTTQSSDGERYWKWMPAVSLVTILLLVLFSDAKRWPLTTLSLMALTIWCVTGWWMAASILFGVVAIVALDTIWISRMSRSIVRGR